MSALTVLVNPHQISQFLLQKFPGRKVSLRVAQCQLPMLELLIDQSLQGLQTWRFNQALDALGLADIISDIFTGITQANLLASPYVWPASQLDAVQLNKPLEGVFEFARSALETRGGSPSEVFKDYLVGKLGTEDQLLTLGLHPSQINFGAGPAELALVRDVLRSADEAMKKQYLSRLAALCPNLLDALRRMDVKEQLSAEKEQGQSAFEEILLALRNRVVGQEYALQIVAAKLALHHRKQDDKCAVYLFVGPTGVGKTELAKAMSTRQANGMVMLSMNQYQSEHASSNLFGSPSGYIGSTDKPHMAKLLDEKGPPRLLKKSKLGEEYEVRDLVILFDEFEKAHPMVKQSLLTLLDGDHFVTVNYTCNNTNIAVKYFFHSCVFVFTSNLFQESITEAFEAKIPPQTIGEMFREFNSRPPSNSSVNDLKSKISPELMGRFSEVVPFGPIPMGGCYQKLLMLKLSRFLADVKESFKFKETELENPAQVLNAMERLLYGRGTDIRGVERFFDRVKGKIGEKMSDIGDPMTKKWALSASADGEIVGKWLVYSRLFESYVQADELMPMPLGGGLI